jgi:pyruvate/2-oxoglutarate dehydrogenase complex dihydrolipoamide acyltransferase (E2) component
MGLGAEIGALVAESALDELRAPILRLAMADVAGIPASGPMEDFLIPDRARIASALRQLARIDRSQRSVFAVNGTAVMGQTDAPRAVDALEIPQAASVVEIDLTRVAARLEGERDAWARRGLEPSYTPFFAEALVAALRKVPQANAAFEADARAIRRYPAVHIGLSIAAPDGAAARHGVIRDADTRNALGLAVEVAGVTATGASDSAALAQATVTLADYGPGSALFAVPHVLAGTVVAVRVGAVEERVIALERGMAVAPTAYVCASIDHRALDGMDAGVLLGEMKRVLEQYPDS